MTLSAVGVHLTVALTAGYEFTRVESIAGLHSAALARGDGLYYDLDSYPFTVSPYGPAFYSLWALLQRAGAPLYAGGRIISGAALLVSLWLLWRALGLMIEDRRAVWAGVLLAVVNANLHFWATVGQSDMLGIAFSLWAFVEYLEWRERRAPWRLVAAGFFVVLAVFTKQTMLSAGAAVAVSLLIENRKWGVAWTGSLAAAGLAIALTLNGVTEGRYFSNAIHANLNPFSLDKLWQHAHYFLLTGSGLLVGAIFGVPAALRRIQPLYLYTAFAGAVWVMTAAKVGSDLNYLMEFNLALALCAAVSLARLRFFPSLFESRQNAVTLLGLPLLLYLVLNLALSVGASVNRWALAPVKRAEREALGPYLSASRGRVITTSPEHLVHFGGRFEVEPLIYTLLVTAGLSDPEPLRRDLSEGRFDTVILYEDIFAPAPAWKNLEVPTLPPAHLEAMRNRYHRVAHIPGAILDGHYVYEPLRD